MEISIIQRKIYEIRGRKVMLDFDLAELYSIETRVLKQAVRRNIERFPDDFMFELTNDDYNELKMNLTSQFVMSSKGGIRHLPFAFTEQGVAMLSSVLNSKLAISINIGIMRAFVAMRQLVISSPGDTKIQELSREVNEIVQRQDKMDVFVYEELGKVYEIITQFFEQKKQEEAKPRRRIGFKTSNDED